CFRECAVALAAHGLVGPAARGVIGRTRRNGSRFVGAVRQAGDLVAVDGGLGGDRGLVGLAVGLLLSVGDLGVTQHLTRALVQRVDRVDTAGVVASGFALEGSI